MPTDSAAPQCHVCGTTTGAHADHCSFSGVPVAPPTAKDRAEALAKRWHWHEPEDQDAFADDIERTLTEHTASLTAALRALLDDCERCDVDGELMAGADGQSDFENACRLIGKPIRPFFGDGPIPTRDRGRIEFLRTLRRL